MAKHDPACCCDMRGLLSFLVLFLLSEGKMHGQEIARELGRRKGCKPSPGTIYPALKALSKAGLVKKEKSGKQIYYCLTASGRKTLSVATSRFRMAFSGVIK